ncbi:MAG: hypothetical protein U1D69_14930 [Polynucleobacter sp.]|nr:hypothetical protein [Polynucleobacter sp.]
MKLEAIMGTIDADLYRSPPEIKEAVKKVVNYIASQDNFESLPLTFAHIKTIANTPESENLPRALAYLCGTRGYLATVFEIEDHGEIIRFDAEEISKAGDIGVLINPHSGEEIQDFKSRAYVHFVAGPAWSNAE